jgi:hypothetical protein
VGEAKNIPLTQPYPAKRGGVLKKVLKITNVNLIIENKRQLENE